MPVDRGQFENGYRSASLGVWPCPRCKKGGLKVPNRWFLSGSNMDCPTGFALPINETRLAPTSFVALLQCDNDLCRFSVPVSGFQTHVDTENTVAFRLYVQYVSPAPAIIKLPPQTPAIVSDQIANANVLFWVDKAACMNRLRIVLEMLLDHLRIPKWQQSRTGKRRTRRTTHARIDLLAKKPRYAMLAKLLLAAKWIGNAGSHNEETSLTVDDVFDVFDLLEKVLIEVFDPSAPSPEKLAAIINKKKRPLGRDRTTIQLSRTSP
jgi:hypothetical protein